VECSPLHVVQCTSASDRQCVRTRPRPCCYLAGIDADATCGVAAPERFSMRLKALRVEKGLTQEQLAKRAKVSRAYLSRLEMGLHDPPLSRLRNLAKALGVPVSALL